jgi:hypothetical protein
MTAQRFTVTSNAKTGIRNRAYDDALAGRDRTPPDDPALRAVYFASYRRGAEARARATTNGGD